MSNVIDCKEFVQRRKNKIATKVQKLDISHKKLCVFQVGDNSASNSYIKGKKKDCEEVGLEFLHIKLPVEIGEEVLLGYIDVMNNGPDVAGIIVQLPLPPHIDEDRVTHAVLDGKDVDGFKFTSTFTPCTPLGVMSILDDINCDVWGKAVCVIGQGKTVGKPLFDLLTKAGATVISCNSKTPKAKLYNYIQSCDVLVTAAGRPEMISKANFWNQNEKRYVHPQIIIDVGINRNDAGKLCGDCSKELYDVDWDDFSITPVPGGVGLYTRVSLLENTIQACIMNKGDNI